VTIAVGAEPGGLDLYPCEVFVGSSQQGTEEFPAFVLEGRVSLGGRDCERLEFVRQFTIDNNPASATREDGSDFSVDDADAHPQTESIGQINSDTSDMTGDASLGRASETAPDRSAATLRSFDRRSMLLTIAA
jgi:hypothetical protein